MRILLLLSLSLAGCGVYGTAPAAADEEPPSPQGVPLHARLDDTGNFAPAPLEE